MPTLPFQHTEGFLGPGVAVYGPGAGAGAAAGDFEFTASAFSFEESGISEVHEIFVVPVDLGERVGAGVASDFGEESAGTDVSHMIDKTKSISGVYDFGGASNGSGVTRSRGDFLRVFSGSGGGGRASAPSEGLFLLHHVSAVMLGLGDFDHEGNFFL